MARAVRVALSRTKFTLRRDNSVIVSCASVATALSENELTPADAMLEAQLLAS